MNSIHHLHGKLLRIAADDFWDDLDKLGQYMGVDWGEESSSHRKYTMTTQAILHLMVNNWMELQFVSCYTLRTEYWICRHSKERTLIHLNNVLVSTRNRGGFRTYESRNTKST